MTKNKYHKLPGFDNYMISQNGTIWDINAKCLIDVFGKGRKYVVLNDDKYHLDTILITTFVGNINADIFYKDGDMSNCSISNLKYDVIPQFIDNDIYIKEILFRCIPSHSGYYISNNGIIYSIKRNILISKTFNHAGYEVATIIDNNGYRAPRKVHRLVYSTYNGPLDLSKVINHIDNRKYNNYYKNLEQVSHYENVKHSLDFGNARRAWSENEIHIICKLLEDNTTSKDVLRKLKLSGNDNFRSLTYLIHNMRNNNYHYNITKEYNISKYLTSINKKDRKLTPDDVKNIWESLGNSNVSIKALSDKYNVSSNTITKIRDGKTWKKITNKLREDGSTTRES